MISFITASILLGISAALPAVEPADDDALLAVVPRDAQVVFSIKSVEGLRGDWTANAWGRFLADPEVKSLFGALGERIDFDMTIDFKREGSDEMNPVELFGTVSGGLAGYMCVKDASPPDVNVEAGLVVIPGDERDAFDEYYEAFKEYMLERDDFSDYTEEYEGVELLVMEKMGEEADDVKACNVIADTGDAVIIVGSVPIEAAIEKMERIIDILRGEGESESILDSEDFQQARSVAGDSGDMECYIDVGIMIDMGLAAGLEKGDPSFMKVKFFADLLGFNEFSSCYFNADLEEGDEFEIFFLLGLEGEKPLRSFLDCFMGKAPLDLLRFMPAEAIGVSAQFMDLNALYLKILDLWKSISEESFLQFRGFYDQFVKQNYKIDPEKEILAQLDGRFAGFTVELAEEEAEEMAAAMGPGAMNAGGCFIIGVKDTKVFQSNFEKTLRAVGVYVSLKKEEFQGHEIHSVAIPIQGMRLNWFFSEGVAVFSFSGTPIRSFIRLLGHEDQKSAKDREDFASLIKENLDAAMVSIAESGKSLKNIIKVFKTALEARDRAMGLEPLPFPSDEVVDKYFSGVTGTFVIVNEKGVICRAVGR